MQLIAYIRSAGGTATLSCPVITQLAICAACSTATLYMITRGHKLAGPKLAVRIEAATQGAVTRHDLRPDVFGETTNE